MKILKNTGCFKMLKPKGINATEIMVFSVTCRYCAVNIITPPRPASNKRTLHWKQRKVTLKLNVVPD